MQEFSILIKEYRKALGFKSAKDFHRQKAPDLLMSYESYANLEAGKYLPPVDKLESLVRALEVDALKEFVMSYCFTLMPNEFFKGFFSESTQPPVQLRESSYESYKEKYQALLEFNRVQAKNELSDQQIQYLETDLIAFDIINLFISIGDDGLSLQDIAAKTDSGIESTQRRVSRLIEVGALKQLKNEKYLVTQDAFIIPRRPVGEKLTHLLVRRELERCYQDKRNHPYTRFRFMSIQPTDRVKIESFIDNLILESRKFKNPEGKTHYLQVVFSERLDLE